jgi:RND family efflux transporter MFP subunit
METEHKMGQIEKKAPSAPESTPKLCKGLPWKLLLGAAAVVACLALFGRQSSPGKTLLSTSADDLITVPVIKVCREDLARSEIFDAEFRPYQVIDLHADVAGFVQSINVDIGDRVQEGDLLATLKIPELAEEIERAAATEVRDEKMVDQAAATYKEAHLTWTRLATINHNKPHLVAQQDLDNAEAKDSAADAGLAAAKENVKVAQAELDKLKAILNDCKITAPFSGVITKRYADVGALVHGGVSSSGAAVPLVRLSQNDRLRLDFPVSVSFVHDIKLGDSVEIRIAATGQIIHGKISRFTREVEMATRTMETEVDVPNHDLSLTPGIYAEASLELERHPQVLAIPTDALSDLKSPIAFVVNGKNQIEERPLTLGMITPENFEVVSGLKENDLVMIGNRSQVKPGQKVLTKLMGVGNIP